MHGRPDQIIAWHADEDHVPKKDGLAKKAQLNAGEHVKMALEGEGHKPLNRTKWDPGPWRQTHAACMNKILPWTLSMTCVCVLIQLKQRRGEDCREIVGRTRYMRACVPTYPHMYLIMCKPCVCNTSVHVTEKGHPSFKHYYLNIKQCYNTRRRNNMLL